MEVTEKKFFNFSKSNNYLKLHKLTYEIIDRCRPSHPTSPLEVYLIGHITQKKEKTDDNAKGS